MAEHLRCNVPGCAYCARLVDRTMIEPAPGSVSGWIPFRRWNADGFMTQTTWAPNGCWVHSGPPKAMRKESPTDTRAAWCECRVDETDSLRIAQEAAPGYAHVLGEERRPVFIERERRWREWRDGTRRWPW